MSCVKDWLEVVYYVAFIVLTWLIVRYARKTYLFQIKSDSSLYCKLFILPDDLGKVEQLLCLEIYNHGNTPASDVKIILNEHELATIDFIRPEDSAVLLVGQVLRMLGCNRVYIQDTEIAKDSTIPVAISVNGGVPNERFLQTSTLFLQSDVVHNENERIAQATEDINKTLGKAFSCHTVGDTFRDELCRIADNIAKKNK